MAARAWSIARRLFAIDILMMAFVTALGAGTLARSAQIPEWRTVVLTCAFIAAGVPFLGWLRAYLDIGPVRFLHDWSFAVWVWGLYRAVLLVAGPLHGGRVIDAWLIAADRWLFGIDPAVWLAQFAHPVLTEVLQIAYWMFYLLPMAVGAELYLRGRESCFRQWAFVCAFGFLVSYVGYLTLPAVSPRFTLYEPGAAARDLPGLWLTPYLRAFIDQGGMAPVSGSAADAMRLAPRGAFPSAHALVTLLTIAWAWRYRLRVRGAVTVGGILLLIATVYLRYHYVTDLIAGAILAVVCWFVAPAVQRWLARQFGTLDAEA